MKKRHLVNMGKTNPKRTQYEPNQSQFQRQKDAAARAIRTPAIVRERLPGQKFVTPSLTSLGIDATLSPLKLKEADLWNYPGR